MLNVGESDSLLDDSCSQEKLQVDLAHLELALEDCHGDLGDGHVGAIY